MRSLALTSFLALFLTPSSEAPHFTLVGSGSGARFGASLAAVGDLDGDGACDFVVGAPRAEQRGLAVGVVRVVSGADGHTLMRSAGDAMGARYGDAVAGAGDVDADGLPDVLVGAPMAGGAGRAFVLSGRDGALLWTFAGDAPGDRFGDAVAGAGDVDGDGHADVLVGAPHADAGGSQAGRAQVFSGRTGLALHTFDGGPWDFLGYAVSTAGDIDGDGCDDVLIGAPFSDAGMFNAGAAFVHSGRDGALLLVMHGSGIGDQLGSAVGGRAAGGGGDVDGDGVLDLLLGAPGADGGAIDAGAVEVRSGADGALLFAIRGSAAGEGLFALAFAGDADGDGHEDVLAGAPSADAHGSEAGRVRLVSGRAGVELAVYVGRASRDWFGAQVAGLGDVDGDGRLDLAFGAPGHDDDPLKAGYVQVSSGP